MCDGIEEGFEWVYDLNEDLWKDAPVRLVYVDKMMATQHMVTISGMWSIEEMLQGGLRPAEPILLVRRPDGRHLIRDGHHRYVRALLHQTPTQFARVINMPSGKA